MTENGLRFIAEKLRESGIPYCFERWTKKITYPYFVGEYTEIEPISESGESETDFILTGTTNDSRLSLERLKGVIKGIFPEYGLTNTFSDGSGIAVMYSGAFPVPAGTDELKRIQINLKVKEWSVN